MTLKIISDVQDGLFTTKHKQGIVPNIWKLMSLRARFKVRYVEIILNWDVLNIAATIEMLLMRVTKIPELYIYT